MNDKKFDGGGYSLGKKATGSSFLYQQKFSAEKYRNVRSFLGLKNPGSEEIYDSSQASLWSKTLGNAGKESSVESAQTQRLYEADKKAARRKSR
jgi:hypothetical protein